MKAHCFMLGLLAVLLLAGCTSSSPEVTAPMPVPGVTGVDETVVTDESGLQQGNTSEPVPAAGNVASAAVKEFDITAKLWEFVPDTITVSKGDTVVLNVKSIDVSHGFSMPQFGVSEFLSPGKTVRIEFVADKSGTFSFYCSVYCGEGHSGMKGRLIVN